MKKLNLFYALSLLSGIFLFMLISNKTVAQTDSFHLPDNVKAIVDNSCVGCHNSDSRNNDAKEKLEFDKLGELSAVKKIATLENISDEIGEAKMPPPKFLERFPDKKLSDEEVKTLTDWVNKTAEEILKDNQ